MDNCFQLKAPLFYYLVIELQKLLQLIFCRLGLRQKIDNNVYPEEVGKLCQSETESE